MLLKSTKKLFGKTLRIFRSFFSGGYQRLPKTPPPMSVAAAMETGDFKESNNNEQEVLQSSGFIKNNDNTVEFSNRILRNTRMEKVEKRQKISATHQRKTGEKRICLVAEKLRELEKLDMSNVDHALDIEEVLHFYSRLTCPTYLEIVDKFFMEIFSEFSASSSPTCRIKYRLRPPQSVNLVSRKSCLGKPESSSNFF